MSIVWVLVGGLLGEGVRCGRAAGRRIVDENVAGRAEVKCSAVLRK